MFIFGDVIKTEACLVLAPKKFSNFCCGKNNSFLIGEAAGFISPSSYEGISYAFDSAYILSKILNSEIKCPNQKYKSKTLKIRLKIFTKIINGEIPCYKIAEDENHIAFLDAMPLVKGHT